MVTAISWYALWTNYLRVWYKRKHHLSSFYVWRASHCPWTKIWYCNVTVHRRCSTLPTRLMMWKVISMWTRVTKWASTWKPISSKCWRYLNIVTGSEVFLITFSLFFSTGAVSARSIQLVKKKQMRCQGVVCATKVMINWSIIRFKLIGHYKM